MQMLAHIESYDVFGRVFPRIEEGLEVDYRVAKLRNEGLEVGDLPG
jgi:hypothetical protein